MGSDVYRGVGSSWGTQQEGDLAVRLKRRLILVLSIVGLISISGIALAETAEDDDTSSDTVFNFDYIEEEQFLMWNVSSIDYEVSTSTEGGDDLSYEELVELCSLDTVEGEEVEFEYEVDGEGNITLYLDGEIYPLDEACNELVGGQVTGPEGQVNHGTIIALFNAMYDGENRGCLVRHLAQSDLGKGDQQITTEEADPDFEPTNEGTVSFTTVETDCQHGPDDDDDDRRGPPDFVKEMLEEKFENGPGRSGDGPGGPPWLND